MHYQSFWALTRAALEYSLDRLGVAPDPAQVDVLMSGYATLDAYPECEAVLRAVKAMGMPTAILSNGSPEMLYSAASSSGLLTHLDHLISVDGVRQFKTSPACYELAPHTLQIPAQGLLFVSSNAWDALGATWFGFQTCWVNRQSLPRERLGPPPHHTCTDLLGVLESIRS
jgi:2-haloacid dehalogenase